ncbi:hypothetical protein LDENG_00171530 [Lucifuga dentata]|nr:hypothetical protein LDENG_00171530 [Lucifuga dentata]
MPSDYCTSLWGQCYDLGLLQLVSNINKYVHRIRRTGRCGNTRRAVSSYDLEEVASSSGFNPARKDFGATDTRKGAAFQQSNGAHSQLAAQAAADEEEEEEWE